MPPERGRWTFLFVGLPLRPGSWAEEATGGSRPVAQINACGGPYVASLTALVLPIVLEQLCAAAAARAPRHRLHARHPRLECRPHYIAHADAGLGRRTKCSAVLHRRRIEDRDIGACAFLNPAEPLGDRRQLLQALGRH